MTVITNGKIVTPDGILEGFDLHISGDKIVSIMKSELSGTLLIADEVIDAHGGYVSPGFIDIHADYIEHIASPRPTSMMDFKLALREAERELLTHGVTTMFHSLSLYKMTQADHKSIRKQENVKKLIEVIKGTHHQKHLIHHRFHARFELDNVDSVDQLITFIEEGQVDLLSFMDHTPGQGQFNDVDAYIKMTKAYGNKASDDEIRAFIQKRMDAPKLTHEQCAEIAEIAAANNVAVASHDDDTVEKLYKIKDFGTTISEFPITMEVAKKAHEMGLYTVAGAPNVLLGGSHSGNLAAYEAIEEGIIDILCSDYYPAALLHAIFKLHKDYGHDLSEMFKLLTINPAKAVMMDNEIGSIEVGKKADILIIDIIEDDFPVVTSAFVNGAHVFETRYRSVKERSHEVVNA